MNMRVKIAIAALASAVLLSGGAQAAGIYDTTSGLPGNQNWNGTLGLNFTVNTKISVDSLGVFNSLSSSNSAIQTDLYAGIFKTTLDANGVPVSGIQVTPFLNFNGTADPSGAAYVFQSITPVILGPGTYEIAAWNYGTGGDNNYNYGFIASGNGGPIVFDNLGGALTANGSSYAYSQGGVGTIADNGATRYGAGTFTASAVPEPATWAFLLFGFGSIGWTMRDARRRQNAFVPA